MEKNKTTIMLVDGMSLLFRGYYATAYRGRIMRTASGVPTNGLYGLVRYLRDAIERFEPTHVIGCWDMGKKTFRNDLYSPYKANRGEPPEDLIPQFDLSKELFDSLGIPNIGLEGYEADDCIGTLAKGYAQEGHHVQILTGDHDSLQLVEAQISVLLMKKGMGNYAYMTPEALMDEKGLTPEQIIDLKALMGDASDNYPGVKGIGEKTAIKLLKEHNTIEDIYENLDGLAKGVKTKLEQSREEALLFQKLARICHDVPVSCNLEEAYWNIEEDKALPMFERLELHRLINDWLRAGQA